MIHKYVIHYENSPQPLPMNRSAFIHYYLATLTDIDKYNRKWPQMPLTIILEMNALTFMDFQSVFFVFQNEPIPKLSSEFTAMRYALTFPYENNPQLLA